MKNWFKIVLPLTIILTGIAFSQRIYKNKISQLPNNTYNQATANINLELLDGIIITDKSGKLILSKNSQGWQIEGKKLDEEKVKQIVSVILNQNREDYELISQNSERAEEFGLVNPAAKHLSLTSKNNTVLSVTVGKDSYPGTFVQIENQPSVYLTKQTLNTLINSDPKTFYETPKTSK